MGPKLRKFLVGVFSLAAVLVVYRLYTRTGKTPQVDFEPSAEFVNVISDADVGRSGEKVGKIGDVEVRTVRRARYTHLNDDKQVDREFGFEALLHEEGDEWELEKPFMNIFQPTFNCYITADKGAVRVENAPAGPNPKGGKLAGNVVIHIVPTRSGDIKESFMYLDDVIFAAEKSRFSTAGPVRFLSDDVLMVAKGLNGVYNSEFYRLEYLRIVDLDFLRIKAEQAALFGPAEAQSPPPPDTDRLSAPPTAHAAAQSSGQYYKWLFSRNVRIDTPDQLVLARDEISIDNIFWAKTSNDKSPRPKAGPADNERAPAKPPPEHTQTPPSPQPSDGDVVITCDNGILLTPMDSSRSLQDFAALEPKCPLTDNRVAGPQDAEGRTKLVAKKITYCASAGDTVAAGPLELIFDVNDPIGPRTGKARVPVKVTARKEARFLPASNQVTFEGDCLCTMLRADSDASQEYRLSAPTLTVDLLKDKPEHSSDSSLAIEHLTAAGGLVRLSTLKKTKEDLLGGIELKCSRFDYDTHPRMFLAAGPGVIKFENSALAQPHSPPDRFSLENPCWAFVRDFHTLQYFLEENQVVADARPKETLRIDYFPVVDGRVKYDNQVITTAGRVEADLIETAPEKFELSTLTALGGVTYEDRDKQFEGGRLFYNASRSLITVQGDPLQPCRFNGAAVDAIQWDINTGNIKFEITAPGALQIRE